MLPTCTFWKFQETELNLKRYIDSKSQKKSFKIFTAELYTIKFN